MRHTNKKIQTPLLTVDIIIRYQDGIVLIERKNPPPVWALPGGFVDAGESLEKAAIEKQKRRHLSMSHWWNNFTPIQNQAVIHVFTL